MLGSEAILLIQKLSLTHCETNVFHIRIKQTSTNNKPSRKTQNQGVGESLGIVWLGRLAGQPRFLAVWLAV